MRTFLRSLGLCAFTALCYGLSLLFNGSSPASPTVVILVLGSTRFLVLCAVLLYSASRTAAGGAPLSFPLKLSTLQPALIVLLGNVGMCFFVTLCEVEGGGGGILAGAVSLYMVIPVVYGILRRGEHASARKLVGVALSLCATLTLGLAPATLNNPGGFLTGSDAPLKLLLLCGTCGCWGFLDIFSASMGKTSSLLQLTALSAVGQALTAALAALAVAATPAPAAPAASSAWSMLKLFAGNALGVLGWLAFVQLGAEGGEVSTFAPLISLYVFLPVALELAFLGGSLSTVQAVGLALALAGALAIAWDWQRRQRGEEEEVGGGGGKGGLAAATEAGGAGGGGGDGVAGAGAAVGSLEQQQQGPASLGAPLPQAGAVRQGAAGVGLPRPFDHGDKCGCDFCREEAEEEEEEEGAQGELSSLSPKPSTGSSSARQQTV
jgi:drug/metabolite transporter (DMT)-like permease